MNTAEKDLSMFRKMPFIAEQRPLLCKLEALVLNRWKPRGRHSDFSDIIKNILTN
jgi:hypothetical protein